MERKLLENENELTRVRDDEAEVIAKYVNEEVLENGLNASVYYDLSRNEFVLCFAFDNNSDLETDENYIVLGNYDNDNGALNDGITGNDIINALNQRI